MGEKFPIKRLDALQVTEILLDSREKGFHFAIDSRKIPFLCYKWHLLQAEAYSKERIFVRCYLYIAVLGAPNPLRRVQDIDVVLYEALEII